MAAKRRNYTPEFKAQRVLELISGTKSAAEICREHQIHLSVLSRWRGEFLQQAHHVFECPEQQTQEQGRIAELERLVGQLTLKLEVAKKASAVLSPTQNGKWS
jgi:transposase-like protein